LRKTGLQFDCGFEAARSFAQTAAARQREAKIIMRLGSGRLETSKFTVASDCIGVPFRRPIFLSRARKGLQFAASGLRLPATGVKHVCASVFALAAFFEFLAAAARTMVVAADPCRDNRRRHCRALSALVGLDGWSEAGVALLCTHFQTYRAAPSRRKDLALVRRYRKQERPPGGGLPKPGKGTYAIDTLSLRPRRNPTKPRPAKPRPIIAQVDGSGTLFSGRSTNRTAGGPQHSP